MTWARALPSEKTSLGPDTEMVFGVCWLTKTANPTCTSHQDQLFPYEYSGFVKTSWSLTYVILFRNEPAFGPWDDNLTLQAAQIIRRACVPTAMAYIRPKQVMYGNAPNEAFSSCVLLVLCLFGALSASVAPAALSRRITIENNQTTVKL